MRSEDFDVTRDLWQDRGLLIGDRPLIRPLLADVVEQTLLIGLLFLRASSCGQEEAPKFNATNDNNNNRQSKRRSRPSRVIIASSNLEPKQKHDTQTVARQLRFYCRRKRSTRLLAQRA